MSVKKVIKKVKVPNRNIWREKATVVADLGCGENKRPGSIGVDFREAPGVDVVQNLSLYPWKNIPSGVADVVTTSHLLEHINPDPSDPRTAALIDLLISKKILTAKEVENTIGDYKFLGGLIQFFDQVWRILKPGGQFISTLPFAGSPGYFQDPTHICPISHVTLAYFDPLSKIDGTNQFYGLYSIYRPLPFKILRCYYDANIGFLEFAMEKREIDKSYHVSSENGMNAN